MMIDYSVESTFLLLKRGVSLAVVIMQVKMSQRSLLRNNLSWFVPKKYKIELPPAFLCPNELQIT